jgi:DtxR family transcriptional regulator, Mn-dependent transcriptional regulator
VRALTASVEDYLKAIYEIESASGSASAASGSREAQAPPAAAAGTNEIAQLLRIAPASVTGMLRRLADQGLIVYERYRGVRLTDGGRREALRTIRRHRVIEAYLTKALGYPWDRVHDEAERLEHAASDELIDRMAAAIGEPATDPHGAPIPTRDGTLDVRHLMPLLEAEPGALVYVRQVGDKDAERLRYLAELGITPGISLRVVERAPFGGPITLRIEGRGDAAERASSRNPKALERAIGPTLAAQVFVAPVEDRPRGVGGGGRGGGRGRRSG